MISQVLTQPQNARYIAVALPVAESTTLALRIGNVDITSFFGPSTFLPCWRCQKIANALQDPVYPHPNASTLLGSTAPL